MAKKYPVEPPVPVREVYEHPCRHCNGDGREPGLEDLTCRECIGRGRRRWRIQECRECKGSGRSQNVLGFLGVTHCKECEGQGWIARDVG